MADAPITPLLLPSEYPQLLLPSSFIYAVAIQTMPPQALASHPGIVSWLLALNLFDCYRRDICIQRRGSWIPAIG